jgi:uncharacterized RDD family membrane protein YckC
LNIETNPTAPEYAPHHERVRGADGNEYWKLTCFCGKTLLAPVDDHHTHGRCPQCGKKLIFPTPERHITTGPLPIIPATPPERFQKKRPSVRRIKARNRMGPPGSERFRPNQSAAENAADKLRPGSTRTPSSRSGLISAWPVAGEAQRALATFIDVTFTLLMAAVLVAVQQSLPPQASTMTFRIAFVIFVFWINDGLLQWLWDGSIGKKICVIVVRDQDGLPMGADNALLRPFVKLLLCLAWPLAFANASGLALHDKILGTIVMKGRP